MDQRTFVQPSARIPKLLYRVHSIHPETAHAHSTDMSHLMTGTNQSILQGHLAALLEEMRGIYFSNKRFAMEGLHTLSEIAESHTRQQRLEQIRSEIKEIQEY
jgi:hypothetical protein